jgi:hypothetical protein
MSEPVLSPNRRLGQSCAHVAGSMLGPEPRVASVVVTKAQSRAAANWSWWLVHQRRRRS